MILAPLLLAVFLGYATRTTFACDHQKLKSVHVVFRHGESVLVSPDSYPHNPEAPHEFDPRAQADLTMAGKMQSYKLGQYLHSRYSDFLGWEYRRDDVYARSTYTERARASLLLVLAGLYLPDAKQRWHPTLDWQPISIESPEDQADDPLLWPIDCATYLEERQHVETSSEFVAAIASMVDFFLALSNHTNVRTALSDAEITDLYHKLRVGLMANDTVPNWDDISSRIIRNAAVLRYHTQNYNERLRRLNGGMLLRKIVNDMTAAIMGKKTPKINLYGGHEFNVVALLWTMDTWKPIVPAYSSAVIVELWEHDSKYYVRVLYHDGSTGETDIRTKAQCKTETKMCPFEEFTKTNLPIDVNECYADIDSRKQCFQKG
ncbi:venom acid phosphatase Acph-1-like [Phymastichus coffea]|uniref:venom acid phosphatase Acph-1-like n=1 Tax=Phymastichus coffea TaxID=108790 RepID=UPI00273B669B|nr:venom acid phosphatase Acph-1-like [Phymastichus coffea]